MMSEIPKVSDQAVPPGSDAIADAVPRLALRALGRSFGAEVAVDDLNLEIAKGEFISLLGPSGCGKSTTLRMIAGFIRPSAGVIEKDQVIIASAKRALPPEKRDMVMIFQSYALWPHKTVAENVAFGLRLRKLDNASIHRRVTEMLQAVRLDSLAGRYPAELSGGQQQRVALARAIVVEPAVLLLDEPLSNLDANLREEMRVEIRRLHDKFKMTTIYVTHDQAEAMVTSDRIAVMHQGRIEQVDAPRALYARPRTRFVAGFIGRTNLLGGLVRGEEVVFDHFTIACDRFAEAAALQGQVSFSLRPQSIHLYRQSPPASDRVCVVPGVVTQRAYLGEHWVYTVRPAGSALALRVTARPHEVFELDEKVWLELDPRQMALLEPE